MRILLILTVIAAALAAGVVWFVWSFDQEPLPLPNEEFAVTVAPGAGPLRIVRDLEQDGMLPMDPRWSLWLRWRAPAACQHAGEHRLRGPLTPAAFLQALCSPVARPDLRVTLPEGQTRWHVADRLEAAGVVDRDAFLSATEDPALLSALGIHAPHAEGYLFPDTYAFFPGTAAEDVVRRMVARFRERIEPVLQHHADAVDALQRAHGWGTHELFILASLVEAEAQVAEERPRIAQVFLNRIRIGMRLQTDPTCVYSPERYLAVPTPHDCRGWDNPYSTYRIDGLPPTPIAGFRPESLEAILAPSGERTLLYFVAMRDGTGRHAFAETLREHNANVNRYLRRR